ncbi:MAG: hypothetical protein AAGA03_20215, partial [Planctomycetota bacterium]
RLAANLGIKLPTLGWWTRVVHQATKRLPTAGRLEAIIQGPAIQASSSHRSEVSTADYCCQIMRPLGIFDPLWAAKFRWTAVQEVKARGTFQTRMSLLIESAAAACFDRGGQRMESELLLHDVTKRVVDHGDPRLIGQLYSSIAYCHSLSLRWSQVREPTQISLDSYAVDAPGNAFAIAHATWPQISADFFLGHWKSLQRHSEELMEEAIQSNDIFRRVVATTAMGGVAMLVDDRPDRLAEALQHDGLRSLRDSADMIRAMWMIAEVQRQTYLGEFDNASSTCLAFRRLLKRTYLGDIQLLRIQSIQFKGLLGLHQLTVSGGRVYVDQVRTAIRQLRGENNPFALVQGHFFEGLLHKQLGSVLTAVDSLQSAMILAADERLRPIHLAAQDALAVIDDKNKRHSLIGRMERQGVARPDRLRRLYTC